MSAPLREASPGSQAGGGAVASRPAVESHRYATPSVREMTRAETDDQRRLVSQSLLAKPA
jgi:hypothetical protein